MNEFLTTLRSIHLLLIAVSLALGAFALSPRDSQLYHAAQQEAESLTKVNFDQFILYAYILLNGATEEYIAEIRESLADEQNDLHIDVDENPSASLFIYTSWPKADEPIAKIRDFVNNFKYSLLAIDIPHGKSSWRKIFGDPVKNKPARCYTGTELMFGVDRKQIVPCPPLRNGGRLVDVGTYEILPAPEGREPLFYATDGVLKERVEGEFTVVFTIENKEQEVMYLTPDKIRPIKPRNALKNYGCVVILNEIGAAEKISPRTSANQGRESAWDKANKQAKESPCYENELNENEQLKLGDHFQRLFPNLHELYAQIAGLSPAQAAEKLSIKSMQSRQTLSIGGLSIDERLVAIAGPATVLAVAVYLLVNLVMLRTALEAIPRNAREPLLFPWLCLYNDRLSRILTFATVTLIPTSSILATLWKASSYWSWSVAFGGAVLCLVFACGYLSLQVIKHIRRLNVHNSDEALSNNA